MNQYALNTSDPREHFKYLMCDQKVLENFLDSLEIKNFTKNNKSPKIRIFPINNRLHEKADFVFFTLFGVELVFDVSYSYE